MSQYQSGWKKPVKFVIVLGLLTLGAALYMGCSEESLPPPRPSNTGTIIVTGEAV